MGANYIVAVADQGEEPEEVQPLTLPSVSITQFDWNTDRDGAVDDSAHRGVNYGYTITNSDLPIVTTIGFYWASGVTTESIIQPVVDESAGTAVAVGDPSPPTVQIQTGVGVHEYQPDSGASEGFAQHNDPARWGVPPSDATYILAVMDPLDQLVKVAEAPLVSEVQNNVILVAALPLASASQVLKGAVATPTTSGAMISTSFTPGGGTIPMSEAEVVLGVNHFNWYQQLIYAPSYWYPYTLLDLDYSDQANVGVTSDGIWAYSDSAPKDIIVCPWFSDNTGNTADRPHSDKQSLEYMASLHEGIYCQKS